MTAGILVWAYTLLLPSFADAGIVGDTHSRPTGPWGSRVLRPQALLGLDLPPLVHGVMWSLCAQRHRLCGVLAARARRPRSSGCRPTCSCRPTSRRCAELPALALLGHGRGADHARSRAISAKSAPAPPSRALRRAAASASIRKQEADFQLLRYAEHLLASAIGAASSRLVLSLLLRKRTVSTKAALQAARRRQRRDPLQPRNPADRARPRPPGHRRVRQGPASDLLEPAVRRNSRPAAAAHPRRHRRSTRSCASTPSAARSSRRTVDAFVRERLARYVSRAASRSSSASPNATSSWRCAPTACRTAASSPPSPTSRRA